MSKAPEEIELERLEGEQALLIDKLAANELDLEKTKGDVARFRRRYFSEVGKYYAELDELDAVIAALQARYNPSRADLLRLAVAAEEQARSSAIELGNVDSSLLPPLPASAEVKLAYRRAATLMHPDRATTDAERERRHGFMTRLNILYEAGSLPDIHSLIAEFGHDPEAIAGDDLGSRMIKVIRRISQIRRRLNEIARQLEILRGDSLYQLMIKTAELEVTGLDGLSSLKNAILKNISTKQVELRRLREELG